MHFAYVDEAGTSNPEHEPWVVVAGVLISDKKWRAIEARLTALADEYAPPDKREGFIFHAKELWSGGKVLDRETYPAERRWEALRRLCALMAEFRLPIIQGSVHRASYVEQIGVELSPREAVIDAQVVAFTFCVTAIDSLMRNFPADEIATVTVERNTETIRLFREQQRMLKDETAIRKFDPRMRRFWPLEKIVDSVGECEKHDSSILQLADVAAFVLKKQLMGDAHIEPYLAELPPVTGFQPSISDTYARGE